jgi:hypothetical protein
MLSESKNMIMSNKAISKYMKYVYLVGKEQI